MRRQPARARRGGVAAAPACLALAGLALAGPAAGGVFTPAAGCQLHMTVQERSCSVAQHYTCAGDAPGDQRVAYFGKGGELEHLSRIDAETRWIESEDPQSGIVERLLPGAADEASLAKLLAGGRDDFDFWTEASDGLRMHHVGHDELTGETREVDGVTLDVTRFALTSTDAEGKVLFRRTGQQFVSRAHGRFYGGVETDEDWTGTTERVDNSPVLFVMPGEDGFGSTDPQFGCDLLITGTPAGGGA